VDLDLFYFFIQIVVYPGRRYLTLGRNIPWNWSRNVFQISKHKNDKRNRNMFLPKWIWNNKDGSYQVLIISLLNKNFNQKFHFFVWSYRNFMRKPIFVCQNLPKNVKSWWKTRNFGQKRMVQPWIKMLV